MSTQSVIALLGKRDTPTDAVEEYCRYLGKALEAHGFALEIRRVPWEKHGWPASMDVLRLMAQTWSGQWVLLQYTALAWSSRGFPGKFLEALEIARAAGAKVGVVYHDARAFQGKRWIDRLRRAYQEHVMRKAMARADLAVFPVPMERLKWVGEAPGQAVFVPVGANLPVTAGDGGEEGRRSDSGWKTEVPTVGVFSITGGAAGARETEEIVQAARAASAKAGRLRLSVFGRHAEEREQALRDGLKGSGVELNVEGVVEPAGVVQRLEECEVLLFLRGAISSRRSSAIAGIACGRPVIAYAGEETAAPITEAGVVLLQEGDHAALHAALSRVLTDSEYRSELAARSRAAQEKYFSWRAIGAEFAAQLKQR